MRALFLASDSDMTALVRGTCTRAHISLRVVRSWAELQRAAREGSPADLLMLDWSDGRRQDTKRARALIRAVDGPTWILQGDAGSPQAPGLGAHIDVVWLPSDIGWRQLLVRLRSLRAAVASDGVGPPQTHATRRTAEG